MRRLGPPAWPDLVPTPLACIKCHPASLPMTPVKARERPSGGIALTPRKHGGDLPKGRRCWRVVVRRWIPNCIRQDARA
jgi:hypothetical protein